MSPRTIAFVVLAVTISQASFAQNAPTIVLPDSVPVGAPVASIDLTTSEGIAAFNAQWRYSDARIVDATFNAPGPDRTPTGPSVSTYDIVPGAGARDFDDSAWPVIDAATLADRRGNGKVSFNWYRINLTMPANVDGVETSGSTAVLNLTVDDYAEVWIEGQLPRSIHGSSPNLVQGFNVPNRVTIARDIKPGERVQIAVFGINGPISAAPANYIWLREAKVEFFPKAHAIEPRQVEFTVERLEPAIDAIIPKDAVIEQIVDGLIFGEGPVWVDASEREPAHLLFSDPNANTIYKWSESAGLSVFTHNSGYSGSDVSRYHQPGSNGLALDPMGRLTINQHGNRRVVRVEPDGTQTILVDRFEGKRLHSPNDLVYRSDGALFFTDPPFGLPMAYNDPARELPHFGVYSLINGALKLVSTDLRGPNGIALSPDERHLYVANWDERKKIIMRYDVSSDGTISHGRVFFDMTSAPGEEALDGLKVDRQGNVFCSGPGGVWIFSPKGRHLGTIKTPQLPANMAWGDEDRRTLYLTARSAIYRMRLRNDD